MPGKRKIDYKWVILAICFVMEFFCLGFCSSNVGLYTKAVTEALDIKRSVYSLGNSIRYVSQVIMAMYFGVLVGRFGYKKLAWVGMFSLTASVAVRAVATEVWQLYAGSVLWGCGMVLAGNTMAGTIVRRWFHKDVGRYTGIVMAANGIGGAIAAQIISPLINNGEVFGYRKAYLLSAVIALAVMVLVVVFLREKPADSDRDKKSSQSTLWKGLSYAQVKTRPYFYVLAALVFLTGISLQSVGSISIVYMTDLGMPAAFIAATATVSSLGLTCSKVLVGTVYDKRGLRFALLMCQGAAIVSFVLQGVMKCSDAGMVMAMIASVLSTAAMPLETVMIPLMTGQLFGERAYSRVLGVLMAMNSLGLCLGAPLGDLYFDIFGTYKPCFWFFGAMLLAVAVAYRFVIRAAQKDRAALAET